MHPFLNRYTETSIPQLTKAKKYPSTYLIPRVSKVIVNVGLGDMLTNGKAVDDVKALLLRITGQKAVETKARKAIAGFKIRQDMVVGLKVTLRGQRMHDFLSKLIEVGLPRTRDFRGLKATGVTADGNLNIGIRDSMIFPESGQDVTFPGLQVTIVSNASTREESDLLYRSLGFFFQTEESSR
jgi:large subunit ribosomal protein L5